MLPWVCRRPAATGLISPLAWEPPYATGAALKKKKEAAAFHSPAHQRTAIYLHQGSKLHANYSMQETLIMLNNTSQSWVPPNNLEGLHEVSNFVLNLLMKSLSPRYGQGPILAPPGKWS